jgi:hypothetical protein
VLVKKYSINDFQRGWFIGDFDNALMRTTDFEVALIQCPKGTHPKHHHKIVTEYNVLVQGKLKIGNAVLKTGDIYVIQPNETTEQEFLEDSIVVCVKTPSIPTDKYLE